MSHPWNREELEHEVLLRHRAGRSRRTIARDLHMSRNTVRVIVERLERERQEGHDVLVKKPRRPRPSKLDRYEDRIKEIFDEHQNATGQRIFEILREEGYPGGVSILRERLRQLRPRRAPEPIIRFETAPGKQGQMDWSPYKIPFRRGGETEVLCFSYVLGFSRRQYIAFTLRRDFFTLIRRHQDAFEYFQGVPEECLYDGEKTIILRWEAQRPVFNPAFLQFSTHYRCKPVACGPRRPETKGKVEAPFLFVEKNLLNARTFDDLEDLRATARWWLANRSDTHIHDTTRRAPLELFMAEEAARLQALPSHHYDSSQISFLVGRLDGFVEYKTNRYSIPYAHIGEILTVRATETEITVYTPELDAIACHERLPDSSHLQHELPAHRVQTTKMRYGLEPVRQTFCDLGPEAETFVQGLKEKNPRNCGYHARRILLLKERYASEDIHRALIHAMRYHAYDCLAVERIVAARARPRTLEQTVQARASQRLRDALPPVRQRPLADYRDLLETTTTDQTGQEQDHAIDHRERTPAPSGDQ